MIVFDLMNSIGRLCLTVLAIYIMLNQRETLNAAERFGIGLIGGCSILTISVIWERQASPYDGWASAILTIGFMLAVGGKTWRTRKHMLRNDAMKRQALGHLATRGKL
jgi:hypothetical protein